MKIISSFIGIFMLCSCSNEKLNERQEKRSSNPSRDRKYEVTTSYIKRRESLSYPIQVQGTVEARRFAPVIFETSGILETVLGVNASYIEKGQLIASLHNGLQRIEVAEAKLNYEKVRVDFESRLTSFGDSTDNPANWDTIKENVALLAGLPSAKVALDRAQLNLNRTEYHAPISGMIEGFYLKMGESVSAMQPIGRIVDQGSLEVLCNVLEFDLGKLAVGDSASIFPLAYPTLKVRAKVNEINPKVESNGYVKVRLALYEQHNLMEGMSTRVEIYVPEIEALLVPKSAVVKKSGRDVIFTVEESLAKWNYVTLGKENGVQVAVLEGLEPNSQVIISNNLQLAHDSPVLVKSGNPSP